MENGKWRNDPEVEMVIYYACLNASCALLGICDYQILYIFLSPFPSAYYSELEYMEWIIGLDYWTDLWPQFKLKHGEFGQVYMERRESEEDIIECVSN